MKATTKFDPVWGADTTAPDIKSGILSGAYEILNGSNVMSLWGVVKFGNVVGEETTAGTGNWYIELPGDYEALFTKHGLGDDVSDLPRSIGSGFILNNGVQYAGIQVVVLKDDPKKLRFFCTSYFSGMNANYLSSTNPIAWGGLDGFSYHIHVPVIR